jgi:hypothetical protein
MHKNATKCNETLSKWCKNKHGASKIIDTFGTYHITTHNGVLILFLSILPLLYKGNTFVRMIKIFLVVVLPRLKNIPNPFIPKSFLLITQNLIEVFLQLDACG